MDSKQAAATLTRITRTIEDEIAAAGGVENFGAAQAEKVTNLLDAHDAITKRMGKYDAAAAGNRLAGVVGSDPTAPPALDGAVRDFDSLTLGRWALQAGAERYEHISGRQASGASILQRVVAHGVAADGTAPVTIEGDLVKFVDAERRIVNAVRQLPMPDNHAPSFKRPRATQLTQVGQQASEGDVLASRRLQLTGDTVTKGTYGGVLSLSEQEIDWTEPAMLGLAIQDLAEQYAVETEGVVCAAIESSITSNVVTLSNTAASDVLFQAVADAAAAVYSTSKKLPDIFFAAPDRWAYLAGLTDGDGRPIFPTANAVNAGGPNPAGVTGFSGLYVAGLPLVVSPEFTSGTWGVARSSLIEFYEMNKGLLSINVPSTLEIQYAYRGYVAANVYAQGVVGFDAS